MMSCLNVDSQAARKPMACVVGSSALTFLHITAGEQAPKWLAIQKPLATSLWVVLPLEWFHRASYPLIWALNHASLWLLRRLGIEPTGEGEQAHTDEELRLLFAASHKRAGGSTPRGGIVLNALGLRR